jgi:hypothetical protein
MRRAAVRTVLLTLVLSGCGLWSSVDSNFSTAVLTREPADDTYALAYNGATKAATVTAASSNTGGNSRGLFWPSGQAAARDAETCARWSTENGGTNVVPSIQEGGALRIRTNGDGSVDAITVTRNVMFGAVWIYNEHIWDTNRSPSFTQLGSVNLENVFRPRGTLQPLPWNVCAKTEGTTLSFVAWLNGTTKPAYGDNTHGGSVTLPAEYVYAGNFGWYAGHLEAGQSVTFDRLSATPIPSVAAG